MSNVTLNVGVGGATLATDTFSGVDYQKIKVTYAPDGNQPISVDTTHGLPGNLVQVGGAAVAAGSGNGSAGSLNVYIATDQPTLSNAQPVLQSGTWTVNLGSINGAATAAKQPAIGTAGTPSVDVLSVQGAAGMTALKVDGSAVTQPVSGTFWQATQPVSGTFWQGTQPVSAASLPLPAGAATAAKQDTIVTTLGSPLQAGGSVSVSNLPATQAISATALPLPAGAATSALQTTINTTLGTPMQQAGGSLSVTNLPATQPVSAVALPLPANAAQESNGNLASITSLLTYMQQLVDLQTKTLAVLQASRLQDATAYGISVEPDVFIPDPTFN